MSSYSRRRSDTEDSPPMDIHKRPSYMEISDPPPFNTNFDERVIRSLESQFIEEEDEAPEPIKTFLRIRPYMKITENEDDVIEIKDDKTVIASHQAPGMKGKKILKRMEFKFSKVLDATCSQEHVFDESIAPLVDQFENGENCLVFSYGATNSGKTYTMRGSAKKYGIIPRTLDRIFTKLQDRIYKGSDMIQPFRHESTRSLQGNQQKVILDKKKLLISAANDTSEMKQRAIVRQSLHQSKMSDSSSHCASLRYAGGTVGNVTLNENTNVFGMWISFIELYNERCYDLLAGTGKRTEVKIVSEKGGYAYLKEVTELPVFSDEEAYALYVAGYRKLEVASTQANNTSSRSHCFFTIRVVELGVTTSGSTYPVRVHRMTFCDLAGCERVCQTENTGGQLKESANINQSLLSLLKVIRMIRDKQLQGYSGQSFLEKIPFRDSKLTRIFQGYFTTSTHIAMIVNVNPTPRMAESSMQTLMNSAIASNVVAFRSKPPPNIIIDDSNHNSSFMHSSLDLEDLMEQTEDEEEEESTQSSGFQQDILKNLTMETPSRILKQKNSSFMSVEKTVKAKGAGKKQIEPEPVTDKENSQSPSFYYTYSETSAIENENLKLLVAKLKEDVACKDREILLLRGEVRTIEARTRETMLNQMQQVNPRYLEFRNVPQKMDLSERRANQLRSRFPVPTAHLSVATQTE